MDSDNTLGEEISVDERTYEHPDADASAPVEQPRRPTVEQERRAKVDANHPDTGRTGLTLAQEERRDAREAEIGRTRERVGDSIATREAGSRHAAAAGSRARRRAFQRRAAAVDPLADPERADPRGELSQADLAGVNQQAAEIAATVDRSGSRAAIARRLARRVASGTDLATASLAVLERTYERPGAIVPLGKLADVAARTVTVEARVEQLWSPARANMAQVGLLADDTGRVKLTVWVKARPNQRLREASRPDRLGRRRPEPGQTGGR